MEFVLLFVLYLGVSSHDVTAGVEDRASAGDASGQLELAILNEYGYGRPVNVPKALMYYSKATSDLGVVGKIADTRYTALAKTM